MMTWEKYKIRKVEVLNINFYGEAFCCFKINNFFYLLESVLCVNVMKMHILMKMVV